jgi:lipopolysaccharide export system protein LptC
MTFSLPVRRRATRVLIAAIMLSAAAATALYLVRRHATSVVPSEGSGKAAGDALVVERIQQTSTRDGRTEWSLEAASAQYLMAEKRMIFKDVAVTFFTEDGQRVHLTSRNGSVQTESHDVVAHDGVVIYNDLYRMETEEMNYSQAARMITSQTPVKISGQAGELTADSLSLDLAANRLIMKGNVRGTLVSDGAR